MIILIGSIIALTFLFWIFGQLSKIKVCPICAGVVITWIALLVLMLSGKAIDRTSLAILMGMSVGALATKYEINLIWKSAVVLLGLPLVWFLINNMIGYSVGFLIGIVILTLFFKINQKKGSKQYDRFKDCC